MKKLLFVCLFGAMVLSACGDKTDTTQTPEKKPETTQSTQPAPQPAPAEPTAPPADSHAGHDHEGHDHAGHDHDHATGKAFQCGDKAVTINVYEHEGETEAQLTVDNITYDLLADVQSQGRFTSGDAISELGAKEGQGTALIINADTAKLTTLDGNTITECTAKTT